MTDVIERIKKYKILPIITIDRAGDIIPVIQALTEGGLSVAEVTFRTGAAKEALKLARREFPDMLLGAGTVLTPDQADAAFDAGVEFVVTPGFNPKVIDHCIERKITVIPGLNSPTQIEQALERGITRVKFFPAEASGGLPFINAIAGPYKVVRFMATGGIHPGNLKDYLSNQYIFACGGSWMVKKDLIQEGRFDEITPLVKRSLEIIQGM